MDSMRFSWALLFTHTAAYTPVSTTELSRAIQLDQQFKQRNFKTVALSCDSAENILGWIKDIKAYIGFTKGFPFSVISDERCELPVKFGMVDTLSEAELSTTKAVLIIGPDKKLKYYVLYPNTTSVNFNEILRVADSLQLTTKKKVATPVDWKSEEDCIVLPSIPTELYPMLFPNGVTTKDVPSGKSYMKFTPDPRYIE